MKRGKVGIPPQRRLQKIGHGCIRKGAGTVPGQTAQFLVEAHWSKIFCGKICDVGPLPHGHNFCLHQARKFLLDNWAGIQFNLESKLDPNG